MRKLVCTLLVTIVFLSCTLPVAADEWMAPGEFEIISEDGEKIFRFDSDSADETSNYSTAAVYLNTEPSKLVYSVENLRSWTYKDNFFFSEDFQSFAHMPSPDFEIAIEFYVEGHLVKTYDIKDLVRNHSKISYSTSSAWWKNSDVKVSQDQDRLTVTTVDGLTYVFDINTGEIIEKSETSNIPLILIFIIGIVAACFVVGIIIQTIRRKQKAVF
jgi:hypothetical protein